MTLSTLANEPQLERTEAVPVLPDRPGDDTCLIERLLLGDEGAFLHLVGREHASMLRYAALLVSDQEAAEKVAREAWRQILIGLAHYEGRGSLRSWMFGAVASCAKAFVEDRPSAAPGEDAESAVDADRFRPPGMPYPGGWRKFPDPWPEDYAQRPETLELLRASIDRLPALPRQVVFLRDVEGWSTQEVTALLGTSESRQRALLHRARSRMRADLERHLDA
jgi:RNA polymerase sigma-70 factor (ECF subfamily)